MRNILRLLLALTVVTAAPTAVEAQATLGPAIAYHDDFDLGVGAALNVPIQEFGTGVGIMADFLYFFPGGDINYLELNGNVVYGFGEVESQFSPYIFGGVNVANVSTDVPNAVVDTESTDVGLNLGAGMEFGFEGVRPNVGVKVEVSGGEGFVVFAHIPFVIGRS